MDSGMNNTVSSTDAAELAAEMAERIRGAHETAEAEGSESQASALESAGPPDRTPDEVGAELRARLETIVDDVVAPDRAGPDDVLKEVIEAIVDDRIERGELPGEQYRDEVTEQLRRDPVVVAELDDIMQTIAREQALDRG